MRDLIVLIPDRCLSILHKNAYTVYVGCLIKVTLANRADSEQAPHMRRLSVSVLFE